MAGFERDEEAHDSSVYVAPLNIVKPLRTGSTRSRHTRQSSSKSRPGRTTSVRSQNQMSSPPLTPKASHETLASNVVSGTVFHNYLRAFYHFHPSSTVSSSGEDESITVPINQGDVILVHSIHPNGWADGTLLGSGARGWLPTNYCEAYDHPSIQSLLNALTNLFDLVRGGENGDLAPFTRQDYVRGMIAGVRIFLERSRCLTREASLVQSHAGLRRMRKGLLGDLSSLVKTAKGLQEITQKQPRTAAIFDLLDELVLKAFKVVTRAVRFLDIWIQDVELEGCLNYAVETYRPPTPPSDSANDATRDRQDTETVSSHTNTPAVSQPEDATQGVPQIQLAETVRKPRRSRASTNPVDGTLFRSDRSQSPRLVRRLSIQTNRYSVSHRVSYAFKGTGARSQSLASERLSRANDSLIGFMGSFLGLHQQSRPSSQVLQTTQQSVNACRQLLAVVEEVWERDLKRSEPLSDARDNMYAKLADLVQATKEIFGTTDSPTGDVVVMEDEGKQLTAAVTNCVRAAGECVARTKLVIERIGDFEFESPGTQLSDSIFSTLDSAKEAGGEVEIQKQPELTEKPLPEPPETKIRIKPPPLVLNDAKPLPDTPLLTPSAGLNRNSRFFLTESPVAASFRSSLSSIPPFSHLQKQTFEQPDQDVDRPLNSPSKSRSQSPVKSIQEDSVNVSITESNSSRPNSAKGDEISILSQASTRITTPDRSPAGPREESGLVGSFGSASELQSVMSEECSAVEAQVLEKTYVHELTYNKEGQISGGSLPALVEQLTIHDSTPDPLFVTTFYLTFRLFATPVELAQCLIDRFDYVGDNAEMGTPVRLRVYNVFKGWLENHWLVDTDASALGIILTFATGKLRAALPSAGKRLAELTAKVTEVHAGSFSASMVKSSSSSVLNFGIDRQSPPTVVSNSQLKALRNARNGGAQCSILDFDPLELARQFTIIESRIFCAIQSEELLASEWTKKNDSKAVNVRAMSTLATDLSNLVADSILSLEEAKKRALVIKQWVKIAIKCLDLNNYSSLMAIHASLNSTMVLRLKRTWDLVSQKTKTRLEYLRGICLHDRNHAVLRQRLQTTVAPCIPFLGMYLTDLTFVDVGNQSTRQLSSVGQEALSVINFDKHMRTAKIIGQIQRFQEPYHLTAIPEMQEWMQTQIQRVRSSDQSNVQSYYRRSLVLEPREQVPKLSPTESTVSTFSFPSRESAKEKFDFLGSFHFSSNSGSKEKLNP